MSAAEWIERNADNRMSVAYTLDIEPDSRSLRQKGLDVLAEQGRNALERGYALRAVLVDRCGEEYRDVVLQGAYTAKAVLCILLLPQRGIPLLKQILAGDSWY